MGHLQDAIADFKGQSFRILMYHSISDESRYPFSVSPEEFEWQMNWLHNQGVCVQSLNEALVSENCSSNPRVVISFDDGYEDNFTNAVPIMDKYGYKATFFIVTGFVGKLNGWTNDPAESNFQMMSWEQLKALSEHGHIIGAHTHEHINLALADADQAKKSIRQCRDLLAENVGADFVPFAYPYGKYRQDIIDFLKEIGYSCALTAGGFWGNCADTSQWELRREDIHQGTSRRDFMAHIRGVRDLHYIKMGFNYFARGNS